MNKNKIFWLLLCWNILLCITKRYRKAFFKHALAGGTLPYDINCCSRRRPGVSETAQYKITVFQNGMNFLDDYKGDCDLIFMDIAMPHMDGLETAAALRKRGDNTCLIFITSMAQYALKGYEVNAFDFLVKPLAYELFCIKFEKALSHIDRSEAYYIKIPNGAKKVSPGQITYIESNKHYLEFHVHGDVYKMRGTMKEIQEYFLASHFALVNSSILVNLSMVDEWKGNEIKAAGQTFVLSQKYKKEFLDRLTMQMGQ